MCDVVATGRGIVERPLLMQTPLCEVDQVIVLRQNLGIEPTRARSMVVFRFRFKDDAE